MNLYASPAELREALTRSGTVRLDGGVVVTNPARFRAEMIDALVWTAVFAPAEARDAARHAIREAAESLGILPASILPLYKARGRGEVSGLHGPRRQRADACPTTRRAPRCAPRASSTSGARDLRDRPQRDGLHGAAARPSTRPSCSPPRSARSGQGPFFLQGDHFQTNPKKMKETPEKEIAAIEALIDEAIPAGFFQIDIDTSTLVDLSKPTLEAQQDVNATLCARFTKFIREREPKAMPISVGGEIGEVGKENSTPEEFRAYMNVYRKALGGGRRHREGLGPDRLLARRRRRGRTARSSASRSTSTCSKTISKVAREEYGLAGAVQHGASTLPPEYFGHFPDHDCAEIHLATDFMNTVYDHPAFPYPLKREIERWLDENAAEERKKGETAAPVPLQDAQEGDRPLQGAGLEPARGHARARSATTLEKKFTFLFEKLRVGRHARGRREVRQAGVGLLRRTPRRPARARVRARRPGGRLMGKTGRSTAADGGPRVRLPAKMTAVVKTKAAAGPRRDRGQDRARPASRARPRS